MKHVSDIFSEELESNRGLIIRLIDENYYIQAVTILYKLIDNIGYIFYGDCHGGRNFKWIWEKYFENAMEMSGSSEDVWSSRNAIFHTGSYFSCKVKNKKASVVQFVYDSRGLNESNKTKEKFEKKTGYTISLFNLHNIKDRLWCVVKNIISDFSELETRDTCVKERAENILSMIEVSPYERS